MPEIVRNGVNGYLVSSEEQAVTAAGDAALLDRGEVRRSIEGRFDASRMVDEYLALYHRILDGDDPAGVSSGSTR
jgi:glycosyltransferase involved in cell wall biosynthesis